MTRKEQIKQATKEAFLKCGIDKESFRQGIEWADQHPMGQEIYKGRTLYEDIEEAIDHLIERILREIEKEKQQ